MQNVYLEMVGGALGLRNVICVLYIMHLKSDVTAFSIVSNLPAACNKTIANYSYKNNNKTTKITVK